MIKEEQKTKEDKDYVFDKPLIKTQKFEVSLSGQLGRIMVIRKEVIRKIYHMGCSDGLPDNYEEKNISYEIYREVDMESRQKAISVIEKELNEVTTDGIPPKPKGSGILPTII